MTTSQSSSTVSRPCSGYPRPYGRPDVDLLVGGFPCQDYSVAKTLRQAHGSVGKKGVLWWEIHRLLRLKLAAGDRSDTCSSRTSTGCSSHRPSQRGRDFAVMLASLADLGYEVEWRVVNAAEYGFPQKRRRVFIIGRLGKHDGSPKDQLLTTGVLARALPVRPRGTFDWVPIGLDPDLKKVSDDSVSAPDGRRSGTLASCGSDPTVKARPSGRWRSSRPTQARFKSRRCSRSD